MAHCPRSSTGSGSRYRRSAWAAPGSSPAASPAGRERSVSGGADRAIRVSTAAAVLGVAGIAAYVSYQHAFEVVRAHGESGLTARLEPATIDGLVYSSSMVILYAARHRLPVPGLARWLLALGIVATLAANVAHGWPDGPVGAVVAAWPAASLVGSYELLLWLIRTSAACALDRDDVPGQVGGPAVRPAADLRLLLVHDPTSAERGSSPGGAEADARGSGRTAASVDRTSGPRLGHGHARRSVSRSTTKWSVAEGPCLVGRDEDDVNIAAAEAYRASLEDGKPLSERKLAAMYGKTSRRWARNRMTEARRVLL
jgi:hypothetical protein